MAQELYSYIRVEKTGTLKIKTIYAIDFDDKRPFKIWHFEHIFTYSACSLLLIHLEDIIWSSLHEPLHWMP